VPKRPSRSTACSAPSAHNTGQHPTLHPSTPRQYPDVSTGRARPRRQRRLLRPAAANQLPASRLHSSQYGRAHACARTPQRPAPTPRRIWTTSTWPATSGTRPARAASARSSSVHATPASGRRPLRASAAALQPGLQPHGVPAAATGLSWASPVRRAAAHAFHARAGEFCASESCSPTQQLRRGLARGISVANRLEGCLVRCLRTCSQPPPGPEASTSSGGAAAAFGLPLNPLGLMAAGKLAPPAIQPSPPCACTGPSCQPANLVFSPRSPRGSARPRTPALLARAAAPHTPISCHGPCRLQLLHSTLVAAGNLFSGGQAWGASQLERVSARVAGFTGGALHAQFAISQRYGEPPLNRCWGSSQHSML
jgi:hypothetical protein